MDLSSRVARSHNRRFSWLESWLSRQEQSMPSRCSKMGPYELGDRTRPRLQVPTCKLEEFFRWWLDLTSRLGWIRMGGFRSLVDQSPGLRNPPIHPSNSNP